jgi:hypothetical protein
MGSLLSLILVVRRIPGTQPGIQIASVLSGVQGVGLAVGRAGSMPGCLRQIRVVSRAPSRARAASSTK